VFRRKSTVLGDWLDCGRKEGKERKIENPISFFHGIIEFKDKSSVTDTIILISRYYELHLMTHFLPSGDIAKLEN
jgi:hypothetical protein